MSTTHPTPAELRQLYWEFIDAAGHARTNEEREQLLDTARWCRRQLERWGQSVGDQPLDQPLEGTAHAD